jgi:tripartite-type tricarboxylate transporter receptor subunit TctC
MSYGLINFLGARIKVVQGYKGTADLRLALNRGEIDGACGPSVSTLKTQWKDEIASGRFRPIVQLSKKGSPDLPGVPVIYDYARSDEEREVFDIAYGLHVLGRPVIGAPGIPTERVRALRTAFMATLRDADFLSDISKLGLSVTPSSGEAADALVARFFSYPKAIVAKAHDGLREKP